MSLSFENAYIKSICIHKVGNINTDDHLLLSNNFIVLDNQDIEELVVKYFSKPFGKNPINFHFKNIEHNQLYSRSAKLLTEDDNFVRYSQEIAKNLHEACNHPAIPLGDFIIIKFGDILFEEQLITGLGLYKCDNKDTFLKISGAALGNTSMEFEEGINLNKLDKSALILNVCEDEGFVIYTSDSKSSNEAAQYWNKSFLNLEPYKDDYFNTLNTLELCTEFINSESQRHPQEAKTMQAKLLAKSEEYFHNKDAFNHEEFGSYLFDEDAPTKDSFYAYLQESNEDLVNAENVKPIAIDALKKGQKYFKSVLKLDRYFHVYVHGGGERMEKGFDPAKGMYFYKLFFETED